MRRSRQWLRQVRAGELAGREGLLLDQPLDLYNTAVGTCTQSGQELQFATPAAAFPPSYTPLLPAVLGLTASAAEAAQPAPKNSYVASSEGYNMEGTKKQGVSVSRKKQVLAKVRASAGKK